LAQRFRFFGKKRGHRQTGSRLLGGIGEAVLFATLWLSGCAVFVSLLIGAVVPALRVNYEYSQTNCTILDRRVKAKTVGGVMRYRPEVDIEYTAAGESFVRTAYDHNSLSGPSGDSPASYRYDEEAARSIILDFTVGREYLCWYDPNDPSRVVLVRGFTFMPLLTLAVVVSLIVVATVGLGLRLFAWGKSTERQAALRRQMESHLRRGDATADARLDYPTVPDVAAINDSPGTTLAYRLPVGSQASRATLALLIFTVCFNGLVSIFVLMSVSGFLEGQPDWMTSLMTLPFLAMGVWLIVRLVRRAQMYSGIGPTAVEVSHHPLLPGDTFEIHLAHTGVVPIRNFTLSLVCEEHVLFRQGTNSLTDHTVVYEDRLLQVRELTGQLREPATLSCEATIPESAMHSFEVPHGAIRWKLVVAGKPTGRAPLKREFALVVFPGSGRSQT